jgi:diguanylate cyclase (GGDEF)-like protein
MDLGDADAVMAWHRRGAGLYGGGMLAILLACAVTDTLSFDTAMVLLASWLVTGGVYVAVVLVARRLERWWLLSWPIASCVTLSALHEVAAPASALVQGIVVLSFLFIGLSQPPHWGLPFVIPAALLLIQIIDLDAKQTAVRLPIAALVWIISCEVPSKLLLELRTKQRELELLAMTDSLTGLLNRTHLADRLEQAGCDGAVVLIDIDFFKAYNDTEGHVAGDAALVDFAQALRANARSDDAVFRFGGEEFLVVMMNIAIKDAVASVERIREVWSTHSSGLTFSAGIVPSGTGAVPAADVLLYGAKHAGRDRVIAGDPWPGVGVAS